MTDYQLDYVAIPPAQRNTSQKNMSASSINHSVTVGSELSQNGLRISLQENRHLHAALQRSFGLETFRDSQLEICSYGLTRTHIFVAMPAGSGKSLTFQLPSVLLPGCTIVIGPLVSLMHDQVLKLRSLNINAFMISQTTEAGIVNNVYRQLIADSKAGDIKLLYVTPERIAYSLAFQRILSIMHHNRALERFVIDEAHCVSQMGHDFRPAYRDLRRLREHFPTVPISCFSATCPPSIMSDVRSTLGFCSSIEATANREFLLSQHQDNDQIYHEVIPKPEKRGSVNNLIIKIITTTFLHDSGIVYYGKIEEVQTCHRALVKAGISAAPYHSKMGDDDKHNTHSQWHKGSIRVIVATTAFGLGIDKQDVRFVLQASTSLAWLYQKAKRAGRDGLKARNIILYHPKDAVTAIKHVSEPKSEAQGLSTSTLLDVTTLVAWLQSTDKIMCRKQTFQNYFLGTNSQCSRVDCSQCTDIGITKSGLIMHDVSVATWQTIRIVKYIEQLPEGVRLTPYLLVKILSGQRHFSGMKEGPVRTALEGCEQVFGILQETGGSLQFHRRFDGKLVNRRWADYDSYWFLLDLHRHGLITFEPIRGRRRIPGTGTWITLLVRLTDRGNAFYSSTPHPNTLTVPLDLSISTLFLDHEASTANDKGQVVSWSLSQETAVDKEIPTISPWFAGLQKTKNGFRRMWEENRVLRMADVKQKQKTPPVPECIDLTVDSDG